MRKNSNQQNQLKGLMPQSTASRISSLFRIPQQWALTNGRRSSERHSTVRSSERGFTLIELAIVLVIIGIILGAVLKGQDLIINARAKKFINETKAWEISLYNYYDRKGRFPGDGTVSTEANAKDGVIGNSASDNVKTDIDAAKFSNAPNATVALGKNTYYVFIGNDGAATPKNIVKICVAAACTGVFDDEALKYAESLNTSITGAADATGAKFYGVTTAGTVDSAKYMVTAAGTKAAAGTDWLTYTTITGAVYILQ